ncbi:DUF6660 family protein [Pedobacter alpinus]|uniref:DUF6660 family protein n=1 Tax=Pedobacter alpinus TaxID=1590643 RepID=A0ABW5TMC4_9SPHI
MMRIFSSILMLLILAINFKPCADELPSKENTISKTIQQENPNNQNEQDDCSPFCYCACCAIRTLTRNFASLNFYAANLAKTNSVHICGKTNNAIYPVWQPPKTA